MYAKDHTFWAWRCVGPWKVKEGMAASATYTQEPTTRGRVELRTTAGAITVELWPAQAPETVRRFAQLAADAAYDGVAFHRVVPGTLVQGGDVPASRVALALGDAAAAKPPKLETHSRLKFRGRGFVAWAADSPSQFYITLAPTPWLDGKQTIFGVVRGDDVFRVLKMGDGPVKEDGETPVEPHVVLSSAVVEQPFPDDAPIVRRSSSASSTAAAAPSSTKKSRINLKVEKNRSALSFAGGDAGDDDDDDVAASTKKFRSVHDFKRAKREEVGSDSESDASNDSERERKKKKKNSKKDKPSSSSSSSSSPPPPVPSSTETDVASASAAAPPPTTTTTEQRDAALADRLKAFAAKRRAAAGDP